MDLLVAQRAPVRRQMTRSLNELDNIVRADDIDGDDVKARWQVVTGTFNKLKELDEQIQREMTQQDGTTEAQLDTEYAKADEYELRFTVTQLKVNAALGVRSPSPAGSVQSVVHSEAQSVNKSFKLPKIELPKFNGELKNWMRFWSQFNNSIHENDQLTNNDKFQFLLQCLVEGTEPHKIVSSYPFLAHNYEMAIKDLTERYGNEDILLQIYLRDLLSLVVTNANSKTKLPLSQLQVQLETNLRALETLNLSAAEPSTWLFPLVESCLNKELFLTWQRYLESKPEDVKKARLDLLREFLKVELQHERRAQMANRGFTQEKEQHDKVASGSQKTVKKTPGKVSTAASLNTTHVTAVCIFCGKGHMSADCLHARTMSFETRQAAVREGKACFVCLRTGHSAKKCKALIKCFLCHRKHATVICGKLNQTVRSRSTSPVMVDKQSTSSDASTSTATGTTAATVNNQVCSSDVMLQTLLVKIKRPDSHEVKTVRAFIDGGSQYSYLLKETIETLRLEPQRTERIQHAMFGGHSQESIHGIYCLQISRPSGATNYITCQVRDEGKICVDIPKVPHHHKDLLRNLKEKKIWISDMEATDGASTKVELLIGADLYSRIVTGKLDRTVSDAGTNMSNLILSMKLAEVSLRNLWDLETLGISDPSQKIEKIEHDSLVKEKLMESMMQKEEGRYIVPLPWKASRPDLHDNREVAQKRLESTLKRVKKMGLMDQYDNTFNEWEQEGFIEVVPRNLPSRSIHYLPHRPVFRPEHLTTPVRPVFDASCKTSQGYSLNDCLETGPNMVQLLLDVLLRFRKGKIGVLADIRKAFLMIEVREEDKDYLRFLWTKEGKVMEYRHNRVPFGATCSPFLLAAVLDHHLGRQQEKEVSEVALKLKDSLYVDNCVTSVNTLEEGVDFQSKATQLLADIKMDLRDWHHTGDNKPDNEQKVLGLSWNKTTDTLSVIQPEFELPAGPVTKRFLLSTVQKIFDPLGFLCPVLLLPKRLLQATWKKDRMEDKKCNWDDPLSEDIVKEFMKWYEDFRSGQVRINVPRMVTANSVTKENWQLHVFSDASADAYAATVFLRVVEKSQVSVQLVLAKTRVTPIQPTTIPRLELLGCLLASRLANTVTNALQLDDIPMYFWTDSSTALTWIKKEAANWGVFVANRVKEINLSTRKEDWHHVPGTDNPADVPSRGCTLSQLLSSRWWEGPTWLYQDLEIESDTEPEINEEEVMAEAKKSVVMNHVVVDLLPDKEYKFSTAVHINAWTLRFVHNCKSALPKRWSGNLSNSEISASRRRLFQQIQQEAFPEASDNVKGIKVYKDEDNLLRVKTKLTESGEEQEFVAPIILPNDHPLIAALIKETHENGCHAGVSTTVSLLRRTFWILKCRQAVKKVINRCVKCKRFSVKQATEETPTLPKTRVTEGRIFQTTGIDLAGPLFLKDGSKVWIVLFTCAVYRAVHLELVTSLSTEAFIQALKRFIARRGRPTTIYTDNGKNFVGTANLLRKLNWDQIRREGVLPIDWRFNPPFAAWWGGWWERLIRLMKDLLKKILGKRVLTYEELLTSLCQTEDVMNSRPLTYLSEHPDDLVSLTPAMFFKDIRCSSTSDLDISEQALRKRWRYRINLLKELKQRFLKEYLGLLVQQVGGRKRHSLKEGDIVLIGSDVRKRLDWPLGKILTLIPGKDNRVRTASVKTKDGILLRPIQRLYPLETTVNKQVGDLDDSTSGSATVGNEPAVVDNEVSGDIVSAAGQSSETQLPDPAPPVDIKTNRTSRFGRPLKEPSRLNL